MKLFKSQGFFYKFVSNVLYYILNVLQILKKSNVGLLLHACIGL